MAVVERNSFIVIVLCAYGVILAAFARAAIQADSWYVLLAGRAIVESGLPHHDTFTVMASGRDWADQQWLAQLAAYGLWDAAGWPLALLLGGACFVGAFGLAAIAARLGGASERSTALVIIVSALVGLPNTAFRAQLPAYTLFAGVLLILLRDQASPSKRVYFVFPLLMLWANLHGSVVLGAGLVSLYGVLLALRKLRASPTAGSMRRPAALALLPWACILASPYALGLPSYYKTVLSNPALTSVVGEWGASSIRSQPIFFAVMIVASWLVVRGRASSVFEQLAFAAVAIGGLTSIRNIIWFAIVAVAVVPQTLDAIWAPSTAPRRPRVNLVLAGGAIAALIVTVIVTATRTRSYFEQDYPSAFANRVATTAGPTGRIFASDRYGDWLLFEQPQLTGRIAFDARFELLTQRQIRGLGAFFDEQGPSWRRAADGYGLVVLNRDDGPSPKQLGGAVVARSGDVLLVRR